MQKDDIKNLTRSELKNELMKIHEAPYRAEQIFFWIYQKGISDFENMKNIPPALKDKLKERFFISRPERPEHLKSKEGAEKFVFRLSDNRRIETVVIPAKDRMTICLSTQVGCKFRCSFCASGMRGFIRNLMPSEIVNQLLFIKHALKYKLTNFVFMGMGEPLDNYDNVTKAITLMNDPKGLGIGARRITISTCGIIPGIEKLIKSGLGINLSVSLHAGNEKLRSELIPLNKRYPLADLLKACRNYIEVTGRAITLEYALIKNKNSSFKDADEVSDIAKRLKAKVNLIRCSSVPGSGFIPPPEKDIGVFMKRLIKKGVNVTLRMSKGEDIRAACGQLAG